jgi:tetratricopeptide (TPR) repeat protein
MMNYRNRRAESHLVSADSQRIWAFHLLILMIAAISMGRDVGAARPGEHLPPRERTALEEAFREYLTAAEDLSKDHAADVDREIRLASFHQAWKSRLTKALAQAPPNDPGSYQVLCELRSISTALRELDGALALSRFLVDRAPTDAHRARALSSIVNTLALSINTKSDLIAKDAIVHDCETAGRFVRENQEALTPIEAADLFNTIGDIFAHYGDYKQASSSYIAAADNVGRLGSGGKLGGLFEDIILLKAISSDLRIRSGESDALVERLLAVEGGAYERGYRLLEAGRLIDPDEGAAFARFVVRKMSALPSDSWIPCLHKELAEVSLAEGDYAASIEFVTKFLSVDFNQFNPKRPALPDPKRFILDALDSFRASLLMLQDEESKKVLDGITKRLENQWREFGEEGAGEQMR